MLHVHEPSLSCTFSILASDRLPAKQSSKPSPTSFRRYAKKIVYVLCMISFSDLDNVDPRSSRVSSVLMCLDFRPRIELSYRTSWVDQFRTKKRLNAEFLNCKPARFLGVWLHNQNPRKSAGDKVQPIYLQANGGFCTVSLTGKKNVLNSPRKWSHLCYIKQAYCHHSQHCDLPWRPCSRYDLHDLHERLQKASIQQIT